MKKTLSFIMALCMILSVCFFSVSAAEATVGSVAANYTPEGTAITDAAGFAAMTADGSYYLANDITIDATWNAGAAVSSTYADNTAFTGTLDGNGKTITTTAPLFANLQGTVKNLTIDGAIADSTLHNANLSMWTKGTATVENVLTKADINAGKSSGGIFGYCATGSYITITNCQNDANITCSDQVGGMVGYIQDYTITVTNCVNNGNLTTSNYGAGIVGRVGRDAATAPQTLGTFTNCVNNGKVVGAKGQTSGILGYLVGDAVITDCVNYGEIVNETAAAGGIFGAHGNFEGTCALTVDNCVNYGTIKGVSLVAGIAGRHGRAVQYAEGSYRISNCVNYGDVIAVATEGYTGTMYVGGITGYSYGGSKLPNGVINCVNLGDISSDSTNSTGAVYVAGIIGYVNALGFEAQNNINAGNISCTGNTTTVTLTVYNKNVTSEGTINNYSIAIEGIPSSLIGDPAAESTAAGIAVTADQLASGEVAYLINEAAGETIYYQSIGTDKAPVLTPAKDGANVVEKKADGSFSNPAKVEEPAPTGDSALVFAVIALISVLGVAVVAKRREN